MNKTINVPVDQEMLLTLCTHCGLKFVLQAVLENTNENELFYGAPQFTLLFQTDKVFCPYCGKKIKE